MSSDSMTEVSPSVALISDFPEVSHPASYGWWVYNVQQLVCAGEAGISLWKSKTLVFLRMSVVQINLRAAHK